jgi:hypothetical protein
MQQNSLLNYWVERQLNLLVAYHLQAFPTTNLKNVGALYEEEIGTADPLHSVLGPLPHVAVRSNAMHFQILQQTGVYAGEFLPKHSQMKLGHSRTGASFRPRSFILIFVLLLVLQQSSQSVKRL